MLDKVNFTISLPPWIGPISKFASVVELTPLNSVGIFVAILNGMAVASVISLLEEPAGTGIMVKQKQEYVVATDVPQSKRMDTASKPETTITDDNETEEDENIGDRREESSNTKDLWKSLYSLAIPNFSCTFYRLGFLNVCVCLRVCVCVCVSRLGILGVFFA